MIPGMSSVITNLDQIAVRNLNFGGAGVSAAGKLLSARVCPLMNSGTNPYTATQRTYLTTIQDGANTLIASFQLNIVSPGNIQIRTPPESNGQNYIVYSAGTSSRQISR
jgi:hypothetical protein